MKDFDLDKLERKNIYKVPENMFENIQDRVLGQVNDFDLDNLERKNIYQVHDHIFEDIQKNVMERVNGFDLEKLERKNIYQVPDKMFENIQNKVLSEIKANKKAPIFKLNWGYAAAASLALIFGSTFLYNSFSDSNINAGATENLASTSAPKKESEIAYETLQSDLTSVESSNQTIDNQQINTQIRTVANIPEKTDTKPQTLKPVSTKPEAQMNEYIESLTSSEIAELANNSSQDVYLDLYN